MIFGIYFVFEYWAQQQLKSWSRDLFSALPYAVAPAIGLTSKPSLPVYPVNSTLLLPPKFLGPSFLPMHFLFGLVIGWVFFKSKKRGLNDDEFRVIPGFEIPVSVLWYSAGVVTVFTVFCALLFDMFLPSDGKAYQFLFLHLYTVDLNYPWLLSPAVVPSIFVGLKQIFMVTLETVLVIRMMRQLHIMAVLLFGCSYSFLSGFIYAVIHARIPRMDFNGAALLSEPRFLFNYEVHSELLFHSLELAILIVVCASCRILSRAYNTARGFYMSRIFFDPQFEKV